MMIIRKFYSDTDYYSFVNTLYDNGCEYTTRGVDVYIEDPPSWIMDVIAYFELEYETC